MSWWVTDYIAVSEDETQQLCNIQSDAVSDLPAQDQTSTAGFTFVRGSKAYVLDTSGQYIMNSSGQWILQKSGQEIEIGADDIIYDNTSSGMTATKVQDAIDEIKDLDDMQDRALAELYGEDANQQLEIDYAINTGAKNLLNNQYLDMASGTGVTITDNNDGTYNLSGTTTGTATYLYTRSANFSSLYGLKIGGTYTITAGSNKVLIRVDYSTNGTSWDNGEDGQPLVSNVAGEATFTVPASTIGLYIRFRSTASHGSLDGTVLKPMIRDAVIRNSTFEPYAPTNRELYETKITLSDIFGLGKVLTNGDDMNSLSIGRFTCANGTVAANVSNAPWTNAGFFGWTMESVRAGDRLVQLAIKNNENFEIAKRRYAGTWSAWVYDITVPVSASVQSLNSPMTLNLDRNELNESLDSIPEEEEGEEDD